MKKLLSFLTLFFVILSCKNDDVDPSSFVKIGEFQFDVQSTYFQDYDQNGSGFNTEFYLFGLNELSLKQCISSNDACEMNGLYLDIYSDKKIPQDGTYILDKAFVGVNRAKAELIYTKTRGELYAEIVSGTVEVKGTGTNNLSIKVEGRTSDGQTISAEYSGKFSDAGVFLGEELLQNAPNFQNSKSFSNALGRAKLANFQFDLNFGLYDDYGRFEDEYNMEFYMFNLPEEKLLECILTEGVNEDCILNGIFIDVYSDKTIPQNGIIQLVGYEDEGNLKNYAYGEVQYGQNEDDFTYEELISGTVELLGTNTEKLRVKINGVTESGKAFTSEFNGQFKDLNTFGNSSSRQLRKKTPNLRFKSERASNKTKR